MLKQLKNISYTFVLLLLFLNACSTQKTVRTNKVNPQNAYIKIEYGKQNESLFVDTNINIVISEFNKRNKTLQLQLYSDAVADSPNIVTIRCSDLGLASEAAIISGYVTSAVGLIAAPLIALNNSNKNFLVAFWYFPRDIVSFDVSYNTKNSRHEKQLFYKANSGAMFRNKNRRGVAIARAFRSELFGFFYTLSQNL